MPAKTDDRKYPTGNYISNELLMKAARVLHPLPFKLYMVLLAYCGGSKECWPSLKELADRMNTQIGAITRGKKELIEARMLTLRQGKDGLEHYIVKLPGEEAEKEARRKKRAEDKARTQAIADQRTAEREEFLRQKADGTLV